MKWFNKLSLGLRLGIGFIGIITFIIIVTGYYSFARTFNTIDTIIEDSSKEINKQVILNYENYFEDIRGHTTYIETETTKEDITSTQAMNDIYKDYAKANNDIVSISLVDITGSIIFTTATNYVENQDITELNWYIQAIVNDGVPYYTPPHRQDVFRYSNEQVISVAKQIEYTKDTQEQTGVLVLDLSVEKIDILTIQIIFS